MGRRHRFRGRAVDGVILFDKPIGWSSNDAVQRVKRLFSAQKVGHTGTLDVLATGVLPLCFGEATKFSNYGLNADKSYAVTVKLGVRTASGDGDGEILAEHKVPELTPDDIEPVLENYRGTIQQIPSMYSAIKHEGKPLYKFARAGVEIERKPRDVTIYENRLTGLCGDVLELQVTCSKGTYIRTLIDEIGLELGCGAHVAGLRRVKVGNFTLADCVAYSELVSAKEREGLDTLLNPVETLLDGWIDVKLPRATGYLVRQGRTVAIPHCIPSEGWVKLYEITVDHSLQFMGIGEVANGKVSPRRLVS